MGVSEKDVYDEIPDDVFLLIFSLLNVVDLLRCMQDSQTSFISQDQDYS